MLQTNDIGVLFATMQATYGHKWAHGSDAVPVWQKGLNHLTLPQLMLGVDRAVKEFPDFPPSLGQFAELCAPRARANTFLPAPKMDNRVRVANKTLQNVISTRGPVAKFTLANMVKLKNCLAEEWDDKITQEDVKDLHAQLCSLFESMDRDALAKETEIARKAFCVRQGVA